MELILTFINTFIFTRVKLMKIGKLILEVYGELKSKQSISTIKNIMDPLLVSVSDEYDFKYNRFGFYAAFMIWEVPLDVFWKNDRIFSTLRKSIILHFNNWEYTIYLLIHETGG